MDDLIEALQIFKKYMNKEDYSYKYPTRCAHDILYVCGVPVLEVSEEDKIRLSELGFIPGSDEFDEFDMEKQEYVITEDSNIWHSHHFGSN